MNGDADVKRIGIFGGSFDPVHLGHTGLASDAMKQADLHKVIFVPTAIQPFKLDRTPEQGRDRLEMLKLAAGDTEGFEISTYELDHQGISYSYLTMRAMQHRFGEDARLYFITGTDAFLKINKWRNSEEMLEKYGYIIGTRPGCEKEELETLLDNIRRSHNTEIICIDNVQIDVSSTEIRQRLDSGLSIDDLVSDKVERYIKENGLYRTTVQEV